jgi:hypothetical protein
MAVWQDTEGRKETEMWFYEALAARSSPTTWK